MTRERPWMTRLKRDAKFKSFKRVATRNLAPLSFTTLNPRSPNYTRATSTVTCSLSATSSQISLTADEEERYCMCCQGLRVCLEAGISHGDGHKQEHQQEQLARCTSLLRPID
ncbi:LOW QUALITY PROTEIN: hypothetical protein CVT25_000829 [Psilocybe cyanescens]|uniref:Uncharacterized protein n=1 Tax=Psilocybe cyanescens TaxID=93625 RepID=A0A409XXV0_PSICY|nr:LOW QUALITY PROTEIN: hypothetical protein CVT25_000829 [Psilocybe cyanescens]